MKKRLAVGLLAVLTVLSVPSLAAAPELTVDEFFEGVVSTELVTAVRCPIQTLGCNYANEDCGIYSGVCHCKSGGGTLTCVKNP